MTPLAWVVLAVVVAFAVYAMRRRQPSGAAVHAMPQRPSGAAANPAAHRRRPLCEPALFDAAANGNVEGVRTLIEHSDPALRSPDWVSPLGAAIANGHRDVVNLLLDADVDPNAPAREDYPALLFAALCSQADIAGDLLSKGAELAFVAPVIGSALAASIAKRDRATTRLLLEHGIPLELGNAGGARALHYAALTGDLDTTEALLDQGADPHCPNFQGGTPLRSAASTGHVDVVCRLLEAGADPAPLDLFDKTPSDYAREAGHLRVVELLADVPPIEPHSAECPLVAPLAHSLPPRNDATLQSAREANKQGYTLSKGAASALEVPSMIASIRTVFGEAFHVDFPVGGQPDPRLPIRPVELQLWTYENAGGLTAEARPALPKPSAELADVVANLAEYPYSLAVWSKHAALVAAQRQAEDLGPVLAVMVHPPLGPDYLEPWDWVFRVQVASALIACHLDSETWAESPARKALEGIVDGPADWAITAVIIALFDRARRDESARDSIIDKLLQTARRDGTPSIYQNAITPAAHALLQLNPKEAVRKEMTALVDLLGS